MAGLVSAMKIGLFGINFGLAGGVDAMVRIAKAAEEAGLESVWTGEHVVLPDPRVPPSPSSPQTPFLDPVVALSHVAAHTSRLRLGTGVIILPQRNPVVLAKELASLDVVSKGRLIFGLGSGYLEPEFRAVGAAFERRGAVTDEAIAVLKALWTMEKPEHEGRFRGLDNAEVMSVIPDERLREIYRRSRALFLPLELSTANNAVLEAMACGTGVISTRRGGVREYVADSCGALLEPGDVDAAVKQVRALARDDERTARIGHAARAHVLEHYAWPVIATRMMATYAAIAAL